MAKSLTGQAALAQIRENLRKHEELVAQCVQRLREWEYEAYKNAMTYNLPYKSPTDEQLVAAAEREARWLEKHKYADTYNKESSHV